jgi:hypothetical protein
VKGCFLASTKELEKTSFSSYFNDKRAKQLLLEGAYSISHLLKITVGTEVYYDQYLFDQ